MGWWGYGPFHNDEAIECLVTLRDSDPDEIVGKLTHRMSTMVDADGYIMEPEGKMAVAAAAVVAARLGAKTSEDLVHKLLASPPFEVDDELRALALHTLERASSPEDNELYELWDDVGAIETAFELLRPYREALTIERLGLTLRGVL